MLLLLWYYCYASNFMLLLLCCFSERYVAVCMPLRRREICRRSLALKCLGCIILISAAVSIYKPMYSSVEHIGEYAVCCDDDELINVLYILDMIYGEVIEYTDGGDYKEGEGALRGLGNKLYIYCQFLL